MIALREPSLGPVLGMKGGATGGGYSQVLPMEEINLHFTGDFHAITSANNALMALVDNHIFQGNELNIDPRRMTFKRVLDMNDRSLREVVIGLGGPGPGHPAAGRFRHHRGLRDHGRLLLARTLPISGPAGPHHLRLHV